jgi:hypothetical protein
LGEDIVYDVNQARVLFADAGGAEVFQRSGETSSQAITRPGYGPNKETVVFQDQHALELYNTHHGLPGEPTGTFSVILPRRPPAG